MELVIGGLVLIDFLDERDEVLAFGEHYWLL